MSTRSPRHAIYLALTGALLAAPLSAGLLVSPAWAQSSQAEYSFVIAASSLDAAIAEFSSIAGVSVSFEPGSAQGKRSTAIQGRYTASEALRRLLQGSGLQAVEQGNGSYSLLPLGVQGSALELGATSVTGSLLGETTEDTGSYTTSAVTLGKGVVPLKEMTQSVSVMTRQRMQDQSLNTFHDVLSQAPGISVYQTSAHTSRYISRGSEITSYRVDGSPPTDAWSYGGNKETDMAIYDRVEILRGADGLFSGVGEPGGSINLVRKRPTAALQVNLESSMASWDSYRQMVDVSGPLGFEGKLRGRSVLSAYDADMFYDEAHVSTKLFYGVLEADLTDSTKVLTGMTYNDYEKSDQVYGLVRSITGADLHLPRSTFLGGAKDRSDGYTQSYFFRVDQQLGDDWVGTLDTSYTGDFLSEGNHNFSGAVRDDGSGVSAESSYRTPRSVSRAIDLNLKGSQEVLGFDNDLIVGWDWTEDLTKGDYYFGGERQVPDIYSFNPDDYLPPASREWLFADRQHNSKSGFYGSWRLHLTDALSVSAGGRYSYYKNRYHYEEDGYEEDNNFSDRRVFTPFVGVAYALSPEWSWYASSSDIYKSQAQYLSASRSPLQPITGRTYETGLKGELFGGSLTTAAAVYYTKSEGKAVQLYPGDGTCCYERGGRTVSKGIDLEVSGQLIERLQATLAYNYNQIESNETSARAMDYNLLQPKHQVKLFASYQLSGALSNLKVGAGVTAQSVTSVKGDVFEKDGNGDYVRTSSTFAFEQAGYSVWNLFANYDFSKNWSASFNLNNAFDKRYYSTVGRTNYGNFYGDPQNYVLTLRARY